MYRLLARSWLFWTRRGVCHTQAHLMVHAAPPLLIPFACARDVKVQRSFRMSVVLARTKRWANPSLATRQRVFSRSAMNWSFGNFPCVMQPASPSVETSSFPNHRSVLISLFILRILYLRWIFRFLLTIFLMRRDFRFSERNLPEDNHFFSRISRSTLSSASPSQFLRSSSSPSAVAVIKLAMTALNKVALDCAQMNYSCDRSRYKSCATLRSVRRYFSAIRRSPLPPLPPWCHWLCRAPGLSFSSAYPFMFPKQIDVLSILHSLWSGMAHIVSPQSTESSDFHIQTFPS